MAMLAEKKRRTIWGTNPMGNDWAKDENKFGQRMLEKMGWEPGTGLGVRSQGRTEIIKMSVKNDTKGLGCGRENDRDVWEKQIESFDTLLAELNGETERIDKPLVLPSLEEKSKASRARVHYHKFTRGKDVSKYSVKDLNCILPLMNKKKDNQTGTDGNENNMYEYFKKKNKSVFMNRVDNRDSQEFQDEDYLLEELDEPKEKKKKKKKRKNHEDMTNNEHFDDPCKKKKKVKCSEETDMSSGNIDAENEYFNEVTEEGVTNIKEVESSSLGSKKRKKKKKNRQKEQMECENLGEDIS